MNSNRKRRTLGIHFSETDYQHLVDAFKLTTCRTMAEYLRKRVLNEPITVFYRNKSLDDFTETAISFNKKADAILKKGDFDNDDTNWLCQDIKVIKEMIINTYNAIKGARRRFDCRSAKI